MKCICNWNSISRILQISVTMDPFWSDNCHASIAKNSTPPYITELCTTSNLGLPFQFFTIKIDGDFKKVKQNMIGDKHKIIFLNKKKQKKLRKTNFYMLQLLLEFFSPLLNIHSSFCCTMNFSKTWLAHLVQQGNRFSK